MNDEIDPILVGETDDIEVGTVESFEHDDVNYAVYHLEPGFFCTQGNCNCEEKAPLSEAEIEGEELECVGCGNTFSIVSGDCISDPELDGLKIFDISEEDPHRCEGKGLKREGRAPVEVPARIPGLLRLRRRRWRLGPLGWSWPTPLLPRLG